MPHCGMYAVTTNRGPQEHVRAALVFAQGWGQSEILHGQRALLSYGLAVPFVGAAILVSLLSPKSSSWTWG
ncbi:hypothetical protein SBA2_730008 [Acidobacteriia bacterium SbA2]|nr:hypothetical protein SBA2_730008 [Acidobacteriia bacterium SbA2]